MAFDPEDPYARVKLTVENNRCGFKKRPVTFHSKVIGSGFILCSSSDPNVTARISVVAFHRYKLEILVQDPREECGMSITMLLTSYLLDREDPSAFLNPFYAAMQELIPSLNHEEQELHVKSGLSPMRLLGDSSQHLRIAQVPFLVSDGVSCQWTRLRFADESLEDQPYTVVYQKPDIAVTCYLVPESRFYPASHDSIFEKTKDTGPFRSKITSILMSVDVSSEDKRRFGYLSKVEGYANFYGVALSTSKSFYNGIDPTESDLLFAAYKDWLYCVNRRYTFIPFISPGNKEYSLVILDMLRSLKTNNEET